MNNITRLPPFAKTVRVEADIPVSQLDEFERTMTTLAAGERPRMDALDRDVAAITSRALAGLNAIEAAINAHPTTGQSRRLVRFLAGLYNGGDYPFDLTDLRGLDTALANACQTKKTSGALNGLTHSRTSSVGFTMAYACHNITARVGCARYFTCGSMLTLNGRECRDSPE